MTNRGYFAVGLCQPKCDNNIGSALRACHVFGAAMLAVQQTSPQHLHAPTDTTQAWKHLPLIRIEDLRAIIPYGCEPVAVEITDDAIPLPAFVHPERAFYVFGPEDGSVPPDVLAWCPQRVVIPTRRCLNLAMAVSVVLYDRMVKRNDAFVPVAMRGSDGLAANRLRAQTLLLSLPAWFTTR